MADTFRLIIPKFIPPLDEGFRPAALANRAFEAEARKDGIPLVIGLERDDGHVSRFVTQVFPEGHPRASENLFYAERLVKFLIWMYGGFKIYAGGPLSIGAYLQQCYHMDGIRRFEYNFMGGQVYEHELNVVACSTAEVPPANESGKALGRHLEGCRIGFDLGASDRKVSAVIDGEVVFSEETIWEPRKHSEPEYYYDEIMASLKVAAAHLPRVDAIGGSSAGIIINNRPMVGSLFRNVPAERFGEIHRLFLRIREELGVPLEVINDGDVTALAGSMSLNANGVLGIALGSSEASGYVDMHGHILGWLNEMAFAPIDYSHTGAVDEWSGDTGAGSQYFSQQCVFRLAPKAGIDIPGDLTDAGRLKFVQAKLESGHPGATQIWQSMGIYLGYGVAHYASFYPINHVLILGRCTSGCGGSLLLEGANVVLQNEFPELAAHIQLHMPDEKTRLVGQAIAAASLPVNHPK